MPKQVITTPNAPKAIGPYSQAVKIDKFLFVSGQIPVDPVTGSLVLGGIEAQTRRVLDNIKAVVEAAGGKIDNIVKINVYLKKIDDFRFVNTIYEKYFTKDFPARATVAVLDLPKKVDVEMDAIAYLE